MNLLTLHIIGGLLTLGLIGNSLWSVLRNKGSYRRKAQALLGAYLFQLCSGLFLLTDTRSITRICIAATFYTVAVGATEGVLLRKLRTQEQVS